MIIGRFDTTRQPLLIAEIGNNHEGDPALALELAEAAVEAGADAVKVQVINPPKLVNISQAERIAQLNRFRLDREVFLEMARRVRARGRLFLASVFDCATLADMAGELDAIKIASGDLDFDAMLELAAGSGKPIVLSTGMSTMDEIVRSVGVISAALPKDVAVADRLAVLHCVSLYPTPPESANLAAIPQMAAKLRMPVGYSDHTLGIEAALVALSLGARVIEKHFTLNKTYSSFRDHALSADPAEFARLAQFMHAYDAILGDGGRNQVGADFASRSTARRSIVAARALPAGTVLQAADLDYVRPAEGLPPWQSRLLIGRRLNASLAMHQLVKLADVE